MALVLPFRALRPRPDLAARVASPPYDVLNSAEARAMAADNPYSFLHVTKSEIDLPEETDIHANRVYHKAQDNLAILQDAGVLLREDNPCFYIYELTMDGRSQTGLVGISSVSDYEKNVIKKHEFTRPEKENDRINHIRITGAQTGNVFLAYRANAGLTALIAGWKEENRPVYDFVAADGIGHRVWIVDRPDAIEAIAGLFREKIPATYIADGHHRAASAAKVRNAEGAAAGPDADFFLTTLFPSDELHIMDYNRVVKDLNGLTADQFLSKLAADFTVEPVSNAVRPGALHEFGLYLAGRWYRLRAKPGCWTEDPIGVLDVSILQDKVLAPILGIADPRTDTRIDFVGGIRGLEGLTRRVDSGECAVAFSLYPVSIGQLFDIADSGQVMPPKSTWFEPKLRDGLLTHLIR